MEITLTKKQYLGMGYLHVFKNLTTGLEETFPCAEQEYTRMGEVGGSQFNPTRKGYEWVRSYGGAIMVDNPNYLIGENEYTDMGDKHFISCVDADGKKVSGFVNKIDIVNDSLDIATAELITDTII